MLKKGEEMWNTLSSKRKSSTTVAPPSQTRRLWGATEFYWVLTMSEPAEGEEEEEEEEMEEGGQWKTTPNWRQTNRRCGPLLFLLRLQPALMRSWISWRRLITRGSPLLTYQQVALIGRHSCPPRLHDQRTPFQHLHLITSPATTATSFPHTHTHIYTYTM